MASWQRTAAAFSRASSRGSQGYGRVETELQYRLRANRIRPAGGIPPAHGGIGDQALVAVAAPNIERARQVAGERRAQRHEPPARPRAEGPHQDVHESLEQVGQADRLRLRVVQPEKGLRFVFLNLVKGVLQGQERANAQLLARGRVSPLQLRLQQGSELPQRIVYLGRRHVHFGQPAAVVFHLLQELPQGAEARRRPGGNGDQGRICAAP